MKGWRVRFWWGRGNVTVAYEGESKEAAKEVYNRLRRSYESVCLERVTLKKEV